MLSISPLPSPEVAHHYFEKDDYYVRGEEVSPSSWWGAGARQLGLVGEVDRDTFGKLLHGELPDGSTLFGRGGDASDRRPGLDLTFSAPKSVSLLALVKGDEAVRAAHDLAVTEALKHLEREAAQARVTTAKRTRPEATKNLVVARFVHHTSRELDPQLHTHAVLLNVTQRRDGQWRALANEELFRQKMLGGAIYRAALARELRALGYELERTHADGRFEVKGFSKDQLERFSKRRAEIEALLDARSEAGAKAAEEAALFSRKNKREVERSALEALWREEAHALGICFPERAVAHARLPRVVGEAGPARRAIEAAIEHLGERTAVFTKRELYAEAMKRLIGEGDLEALRSGAKRLEQAGALLPAQGDSQGQDLSPRLTTERALKLEAGIVALVREGRDSVDPIRSGEEVIQRLSDRGLTDGQIAAARVILSAEDRVVGIQGYAGTGKTTALDSVRELAEEAGYAVRGFAPSAAAARELREGAKIESSTLASHLQAVDRGHFLPTEKELWIVDETSMLGNKDALRLLRAAEAAGARVVLVGDKDQLPSIEAGKIFALLQERKEIKVERMTEILRQEDPALRLAVEAMVERDPKKALREISGSIRTVKGREARLDAVAAAYLEKHAILRRGTIVLTPSNKDREVINRRIREGLQKEGVLGRPQAPAVVFSPRHFTSSETKDARSYQDGDVVRFGRAYKALGVENGTYMQVVSVDHERREVTLADGRRSITWSPDRHVKVEVYEAKTRELARGDLIRWTRNDHKAGRRNGETGVVLELDEESRTATVLVRGDRQVLHLDRDVHWDHGYVSTVHAAQGKTAERAILHIDTRESKLTGHESWYVSLSRARQGVEILTDDETRLPVVITRSMAKTSALEEVLRDNDRVRFSGSSRVGPGRGRTPPSHRHIQWERTL